MPKSLDSAYLRKQMVDDAKRLAVRAAEWYRLKPDYWGLPTGIPTLDEMTGGMPQGEMIVLAGGPGTGKTSLATQMAIEASLSLVDKPLPGNDAINVFISAEMTRSQIMQRVGCGWAQINQSDLRRGQITAEQLAQYQDALEYLCSLPLLIVDGHDPLTSQDVRNVTEALMNEGLQMGVVVVDYLQQLGDEGMGVERINQMLRTLRAVISQTGCSMLLLSQYSRAKTAATDKQGRPVHRKPSMEDLLGSGNIERGADQIWALNEPAEGAQLAPNVSRKHLYVLKNRNGKKHKSTDDPIDLDFYESQTLFLDPVDSSIDDADRIGGMYLPPLRLVK